MSMKHTKGKQKIEMKKIEDDGDRMVTFSKRKSEIFKKMSEIIALCDVEAAFLVFSPDGKAHSFGHPSVDEAFGRLSSPVKHEPSAKDDTDTGPRRQRIEDLMKKYNDVVEELGMLKEKEKILKESIREKTLDEMWWATPKEGESVEELKRRHQALLDLHGRLCSVASQRLVKDGDGPDGSSSGLAGRGGGSDA